MLTLMLTLSVSNAQTKLGAIYDSTKSSISNGVNSVTSAVSSSYNTLDTSSNIKAFGCSSSISILDKVFEEIFSISVIITMLSE